MAVIVQKDDPVLRKTAKAVPEKSIGSREIRSVLERMKKALDSQKDGVAIAAPQIGESLRIFVVSERALEVPDNIAERRKRPFRGSERPKDLSKHYGHLIFINPVITKIAKEKTWLEEGCLSIRYLYGKVSRASKASVRAFNERGQLFTRGASGLMAQIFQHEIDHLDGILFIDKAVDVKEMMPERPNREL
ncbi:MAG: peptide deformylase [Candidatus Taylorbacteria bacterium]|nr:peptide deformylase [Candidatus Taylorbacteria bacterium]